MQFLGVYKIHTTPYHPQSNGVVERWHRSLKAALMARLHNSTTWVDELPTVLFGLRAALRTDSGVSAAELTFGKTLRLPGEFYDTSKDVDSSNPYSMVEKIRETINNYRPMRDNLSSRKIFIHLDLQDCDFVFIRDDTVHKSLKPPYDGPYKVLNRNSKVFKIRLPNRDAHISIDRLKPAFTINESETFVYKEPLPRTNNDFTLHSPETQENVPCKQRISRSGRIIRTPVRFT
ncbi:hypothetical protein K1T71_011622 [Dendrolimus kikuchii]|uniref:Uncharacterized protein n=1 Tax=Dendrolimus kikuchii TaxID=765133 RepID=A0ACC1CLS7_9NEOP|nr:hypothetical protein K1T71_011622 [Dendrolimus kikuchii]